ncbi:hypothetical protein L1987_69025 [Smallanthus sonchifolius]|uniref:Uncharacterized protein n=1 Tax=Smallanthus sonchifolius TaxID=185202 RepID=A0ACB9B754_9ASTR|nr:hypothetical protein L1987_69025 [Smallanthus sonchifolius]
MATVGLSFPASPSCCLRNIPRPNGLGLTPVKEDSSSNPMLKQTYTSYSFAPTCAPTPSGVKNSSSHFPVLSLACISTTFLVFEVVSLLPTFNFGTCRITYISPYYSPSQPAPLISIIGSFTVLFVSHSNRHLVVTSPKLRHRSLCAYARHPSFSRDHSELVPSLLALPQHYDHHFQHTTLPSESMVVAVASMLV